MTSDSKKTKPDPAPKIDAAAKVESPAAKVESPAAKVESPAAKEAPKPEGGETAAPAPSKYTRGEGQKPVTAAYKENWNAIFAKKKTKKTAKRKRR